MIQNAEWNESGDTIKVTYEDGSVLWVPDDMSNRHRIELEAWSMTQGNEIKAYIPPETE